MFKTIIIIVCIAILLVGGYFWVTRKQYLEAFLSKQYNANVLISDVTLNYHGIVLEDVTISNPLKHSQTTTISKIEVEFPIWEIFNHKIKIVSLKILNPKIHFELNGEDGKESSMDSFLMHLSNKSPKFFTVEHAYLYNIEFQAYASGKAFEIWPIGYLNINDFPPNESLTQITQFIIDKIKPRMITSHSLPFKHLSP